MRRISGRERAENLVRESASHYRDTFDFAPVAILKCSADGAVLRANGAARDMFGNPDLPLFKATLLERVHPDDAAAFEQRQNALLCGDAESVSGEFRFVVADGRTVWGNVSGRRLETPGSGFRVVLWVIADVTKQKLTEAALRDSEARFRSLLGLSSDWYWEQDENFRFVGFSIGFTSSALQPSAKFGMQRWEIPSFGLTQEQWDEHKRTLEAQLPFRGLEIGRFRADGSPMWVSISGEPFFDSKGRFLGYRGIGRDITERKKTEAMLHARQEDICKLNLDLEGRIEERTADLLRLNRELEAFSYSISHDLRAPLRGIAGFAALLREDLGPMLKASAVQSLDRILANCERMGAMITGLLELSRLGRATLARQPVDLSALVAEVYEIQRNEYSGRTVQNSIEPGMRVNADPVLLMIVLENIIGNAWKYTAQRQVAQIHAGSGTSADGGRFFFVSDNGVGFDMAYSDKLFGLFQRLHSQKDYPGDGIGLATVRQIIERHGGSVWAEGRPGAGAVFFFCLPD